MSDNGERPFGHSSDPARSGAEPRWPGLDWSQPGEPVRSYPGSVDDSGTAQAPSTQPGGGVGLGSPAPQPSWTGQDPRFMPGGPAPTWWSGGNPTPGWAAPPAPPPKPSPMPDGEREYSQMLHGGRHRWWKPILSIGMFVAGFLILANLLSLLLIPVGVATGHGSDLMGYVDTILSGKELGPVAFAFLNVLLASLIPAAMLTVWAVHRIRPRFMLSVEGRFRWRWFARCLVVLIPLWLVYLGIGFVLDPPAGGRPEHFVALMVIVLLSTPFQCAGEEFAFRAFLMQVIGSWFKRPLLALLVPAPFAIGLFALAHGSLHPWILIDLGSFAAAAFVLVWRTGGIEASIALHAVNNVLLMLLSLTFGGWSEGFVQTDSVGDPIAALISLAVNSIAVALILWQARRVKLQRTYRPARQADPSLPPSPPTHPSSTAPAYPATGQPLAGARTAPDSNPWLHS